MSSITLSFSHSPSHYTLENSTYRALVERATGLATRVVTTDANINFWSVHPPSVVRAWDLARRGIRVARGASRRTGSDEWQFGVPDRGERIRNVWFTGENERPPQGQWSGYLSFDSDPLGGRNAYFPYWFDYIGAVGHSYVNFTGLDVSPETYLNGREPPAVKRTRFAAAFIGNPTPMRWHAINALRTVGEVDVYGDAVGRPVAEKARVGCDYRFILCMENDLYPGYVTEKPFDAWAMGAVPIWWGIDGHDYLNTNAMINLADYDSFEVAAERIRQIDTSPSSLSAINAQPLLLREACTLPAENLIRGIADSLSL